MPVSSAIPDQLERHAGAARDIDDELIRIGAEVQDALDAFAAGASEVAVLMEPLGREVRAMADVAADLDTWAGQVGAAFRRAGEGMDLLTWLFDLMHGSPDLYGDLIGDLFAVDAPGRLLDHLVSTGVDLTDIVIDTGEDLIDTVGGLASDAREGAEDLAEDAYDNTIGRIPGF